MATEEEEVINCARNAHPGQSMEFKTWFDTFNGTVIGELKKRFPDLAARDLERIKAMAEYNVPGGKLNRGMMVLEAFEALRNSKTAILEKDRIAAICLGWCIEWCQAFFLVADDVMDSSESRRGRPCWFRIDGVGLMAVNDALLLRASINLILKNQFQGKGEDGRYMAFADLFAEIELATMVGQMLDMSGQDYNNNDKDKVNDDNSGTNDTNTKTKNNTNTNSALNAMKHYKLITKYKTSLYSFYLPFACAFILANGPDVYSNPNEHLKAEREILTQIGHLFQVQDDILDAFGDSRKTGKVGTDIEEGKLTWLLCKTLSMPSLSVEDQNTLITCRQSDPVKQIYQKYRIYDEFLAFEAEQKQSIETALSTSLPTMQHAKILRGYLHRILSRIK